MKKIVKQGLLTGIPITIISVGSGYLLGLLFPSLAEQYNTTQLYRPWSEPAMWLIFVYPFFLGIALAWIWDKTKTLVKGNSSSRAIRFAYAYWIVVVVPAMIMIYSCMSVSLPIILSWTVSGFLYGLIAGYVFVKLNP